MFFVNTPNGAQRVYSRVGIIGPNGAGKSTILKSLTKHLQTISGRVLVEGTDLRTMSCRRLAEKTAVMLTERGSPELMSCWDVVASTERRTVAQTTRLSRRRGRCEARDAVGPTEGALWPWGHARADKADATRLVTFPPVWCLLYRL